MNSCFFTGRRWLPAILLATWLLGGLALTAGAKTLPASTAPATAGSAGAATQARLAVKIERPVPIEGTLEAAMDYPRVFVQLRQGETTLSGEAVTGGLGMLQNLEDLARLLDGAVDQEQAARDTYFLAFLDTGASALVLSKSTADRFGVALAPDAVYHEAGLHGETPMLVSKPYSVLLSGAAGMLSAQPPGEFRKLHDQAVLQVNPAMASNPLVEMTMGEINVIGMPSIRQLLVEIQPSPSDQAPQGKLGETLKDLGLGDIEGLGNLQGLDKLIQLAAGPLVTLHDPSKKLPADAWDLEIPLQYVNYSRRHNPHDKGPLPELAPNPMVVNVTLEYAGKSYTSDWLLDTGAPASMISTRQAKALGLYTLEGKPARDPDFELPLGGIGGEFKPVPGFQIDRLSIPAKDGKGLVYHKAYVLVADITAPLDGGASVTLDGLMGTNLLLPTVAGLAGGLPDRMAPSAFQTIWIDGPGQRLLLKLIASSPTATQPASRPATNPAAPKP